MRCDKDKVSQPTNEIGDIFRGYGERYILSYKPPLQHIKLIRSMRLCKSPGMGGQAYTCKKCKHVHYVYYGCGRNLCCICQSVKREQWLTKMQDKLLKVPYVHLITTLPHQLNSLARRYPKIIYNLMFIVTAQTVKHFANSPQYLGAKTGMISVLHTFGSDMKYHIHVHSLLTFGGIKHNEWLYPKDRKRLCKHKEFRDKFRSYFMSSLERYIQKGAIVPTEWQSALIEEVRTKTWSFKVTKPTMTTQNIELYLARYINRIAITNSRVRYIADQQKVEVRYNDYKNQKEDEAAPKAYKKIDPLVFIQQYLQHVPPPYFQRVRYYGIHSGRSFHKIKEEIPHLLRSHGRTVRTIMEIITHLLKREKITCQKCDHDEFEVTNVSSDRLFIEKYIRLPEIYALKYKRPKIRSP